MADPDLKAALNKAKTTPMNFAMAKKGQDCTGLIVRKKPVKGPEAQKLKKDTKATEVMAGVCFGESGGLMFQFRADAPPKNEKKLKKFISDETGLNVAVTFSASADLAEVDDAEIDVKARKAELTAALTKLVKKVQPVIAADPARKAALVAAIGEVKRMIAEIAEDRPERVDHAQKALVAFGKELRAGSGGAPADTPSKAADSDAPTPEDTAFVDVVLGGNAGRLAAFDAAFDKAARAKLTSTFGGPRGLKAVGMILRDVCSGDPARLRTLSDALD